MQVGELIRRAGIAFGGGVAIVDNQRSITFAELDAETDQLGNALLAEGLVPGDRVAVLVPNSVQGVVVYYALAKAGLVRVPLNAREIAAEHEHKISDSGARILIHAGGDVSVEAERCIDVDELTRLAEKAPPGRCRVARAPDDPFRLAYTGGTTGKPKGVILTDRTEMAELSNMMLDLLPDIDPGDVMLHAAPVTHGSGAFLLPHLVRGATNVILDRFDPERFLEAVERTRATATFLVPTMLAMLLEQATVDRSKLALRRLVYGAAPIAPALLSRALDAFGPVMVQTYGQAEAPVTITCLQPGDHERLDSAGRPYTFVEMKIVDDDGSEVPPGTVGEVVTRGPHVMAGYWRRPDDTARAIDPDGWLRTGDLGRIDDLGFLYLVDRRHDTIISGGFNVYPREVEDVLLSHPAVVEAVVFGLPDERWGERVAAAVVRRDGGDAADLEAFCADRMAPYKRPRRLEVWPEIPKSGAGKNLRRAARDLMSQSVTSDAKQD